MRLMGCVNVFVSQVKLYTNFYLGDVVYIQYMYLIEVYMVMEA